MSDFEFESMAALLRRLKVGREEALQRSLTSLILGGPYPRWNCRSKPDRDGRSFLRSLYEHCLATPWPDGEFEFVDEYELSPRNDDEKGGAPDWAVIWSDRVWIIELKSEASSHRPTQIPQYFELAHPTITQTAPSTSRI